MYYIVFGLLYLLSLLPMRVLYFFSDFVYVLLYYVFGYRKKVVMDNLLHAFPEKTDEERKKIAKGFYRNFTDNFIETIKILSASKKFLTEHLIIDNPELLANYYNEGRKLQLHLGHTFNWEIANAAMPYLTDYKFMVVYMPITNKIFDRLFIHLRSRTGSVMLPATALSRVILPYRNTQYMLTLVADQAPGDISKAYWLNFFGRPTPFLGNPEKGARIANIPVIFVDFYKTKRGFYHARLETGADNPAAFPEGELTLRYIRFLERTIRQNPSMWLWSHRRWKHQWRNDYSKMWIDENDLPH
ncbi:MAG: lysophospholipid acyltransferase family protein [Bacteroidetes bacterium]|nr:lysophospholipid acyltransferase family protein [Bacteroidota bacterium]MBS1934259.1 lysophospholipid acyltransferase family protein [Bacteroidota bacterium]